MERLRAALANWRAVAPMVAVAFAALAGAVWGKSGTTALFFLGLAFLLVRRDWRWGLTIVIFAVTIAWRAAHLQEPVAASLARPGSEFIEGTLRIGARAGAGSGKRLGWLREGDEKRKVLVFEAGDYRPGDILAVRGRFFVPERERNPGTFPQLEWWAQQGVYGGVSLDEASHLFLDWRFAPLRWAEELRDLLEVGITRGLPPDSKGRVVIRAMVLGAKPPRDSEVSRAFRESGAMHVFAVSGLHVTLVGVVFWLFLRPFPVQRRTGLILVMLAMVTYALVTGLRPPAVRATVMAVCFFGAFFFRRRPSLFNALAVSLILVLLWNPGQVHQVGFQLSYGVLLSIGLGVGLALKWTGRISEIDPFFPSRLLSDGQRRVLMVRTYLANLGATSLAAWVGSIPIMIWHFGVLTPVAVLTSLFLIPATMVILSLAFLGALTGTLSPLLGTGVNRVNEAVAGLSFQIARGFSQVPFGHWKSPGVVPADWIIFDGQDGGACSLLMAGEGVMVEAGSARFYRQQLKGIFDQWELAPATALVSHPDGDHVGGLPDLWRRGGLRRAVLPVEWALSPTYREFLELAGDGRGEVAFGKTAERYELADGVSVEVLWGKPEVEEGIADQRMMVMKVHWQGWQVLVTGDLGMTGELDLLRSGIDLTADVVWMGRHEWGVSGQHQFLEATGARVVITSAAGVPKFERPPKRWVEHVEGEGYHLFHQGESGAVLLDFEEDELRVRSYLKPRQEVVLQR